jgi:hypothetical protein
LDFIEARVHPDVARLSMLVPAILSLPTDTHGDVRVMGDDHATVADRTQIFSRVKTEARIRNNEQKNAQTLLPHDPKYICRSPLRVLSRINSCLVGLVLRDRRRERNHATISTFGM